MDSGARISADLRKAPWSEELRATLSLAWPLILANVTQQAIQATDVLLMGRLGAGPLAAATLALNMTFTFNLLLLGLLIASSPMMATALGQRFNAVRDVRRTFRAGLWILIIGLPPYWFVLWHVGGLMRAFGEAADLAEQGQTFLRAYMWCAAPWLLFQLLRNFVAALERPRVVLWLSLGSTLTWLILCGALVGIVRRDRQFRRFHLFGHWWRFDRQRWLAMVKLGWPIGVTMAL